MDTSGSGGSSSASTTTSSTSITSGSAGSTSGSTSGTGGASSTATSGSGGGAGTTIAGAAGAAGTAGAGGSGGAGGSDGDLDASLGDASEGEASTDDGTLPPGAVAGSCTTSKWMTSASSSGPGDEPAHATDGIQVSRWSTGAAQSVGAYYQIDFGGYVRLSEVVLDSTGSTGDHPRGYQVETSRDGVDFSNVIASDVLDDTPHDVITIDFTPRAVRFLRIELTAPSASWWSIHELRATCQIPDSDGGWADELPPVDTGTCAGPDAGSSDAFNRGAWMATASSTSALAGDAIANAFDNDTASRWSSGQAQTGDDVFKLDLGSVGCVGGMTITSPGTDFAKAYALWVSTDDVHYTAVASGDGQAVLALTFAPHLARYLRINQYGVTGSWWSISDITVSP